jgi:predicted  nucleic acid-binding Zn-ribbon protein
MKEQRIFKKCLTCGKIFSVPPSLERIKYCCSKCYWDSLKNKPPHNKGKKSNRPAWNRVLQKQIIEF